MSGLKNKGLQLCQIGLLSFKNWTPFNNSPNWKWRLSMY